MKREGIMVGEKFLPADIIEHVLNLRRLGIQKDIWKGYDGYSWMYTCMPECGYIPDYIVEKLSRISEYSCNHMG